MLGVTGHKLHLSLLHKAVLTEVGRVWCYRSQSVPLVTALDYTYRGGQGLVLPMVPVLC